MPVRTPSLARTRTWASVVSLVVGFTALPATAQDSVECATATSPAPVPIEVSEAELAAAWTGTEGTQSFDIVLQPGPGLSANAAALAAFERAARQWEQRIADPIVVTLRADLALLQPGVIGGALPNIVRTPYGALRDMVRSDAIGEPADAIAASVPQAFVGDLPPGFAFGGNTEATTANLKALGFGGIDAMAGPIDGQITFSTRIPFDFDNRNGVTAGTIDFESAAAHEIGHALGFISSVDEVDRGINPVSPQPLDLFRFADGASTPTNAAQFASGRRNLVPNAEANFVDTKHALLRLSTGRLRGDGRQASHWKDDALLGFRIGVMDPTFVSGDVVRVAASDLLLLDLIGYEIAAGEAAPAVTIRPNGDPVGSGLRVAAGVPVLLQSTVSDADGLGFPFLFGFGSTARLERLWSFGGANVLSGGLSLFAPSPLVDFPLEPGQASRQFTVQLAGIDFLGDTGQANVPVTVVQPTPPNVTVRANGAVASGPVAIGNGGTVQFDASASDPDGLGYPLFNSLGNTADVTFVWSFDGGTPVTGGSLAVFLRNPNVRFTLAAGQSSRRFNVGLTVVDALGARREVSIAVDVTR